MAYDFSIIFIELASFFFLVHASLPLMNTMNCSEVI